MRCQRHVSDLVELLRFPFDRPRRLCVTKNRVFTCTSWPTSPSKRSEVGAFVARKRDPPRQRFPSRGSACWQKTGGITFPPGEIEAWRAVANEKSFLFKTRPRVLESRGAIRATKHPLLAPRRFSLSRRFLPVFSPFSRHFLPFLSRAGNGNHWSAPYDPYFFNDACERVVGIAISGDCLNTA